jgi:hypothetical protein
MQSAMVDELARPACELARFSSESASESMETIW